MATLEIYKVIPERLPLTRKRSEHLFELWTIFSWNIFVMANPPLLSPELVKRYSDPYLSHKWSEQCRWWDSWGIGISKSKWYFNIWDGGMLDISKMNSCWGPQRSPILLTNLGDSGSAITQKKKTNRYIPLSWLKPRQNKRIWSLLPKMFFELLGIKQGEMWHLDLGSNSATTCRSQGQPPGGCCSVKLECKTSYVKLEWWQIPQRLLWAFKYINKYST